MINRNGKKLSEDELDAIRKELKVRAEHNAYAPYSKFRVSAALVTDKTVWYGVNIENRSYGLTICAERAAIGAAISAGDRAFRAFFIYSPDSPEPLPPCGACRQVISEFSKDMPVILYSADYAVVETTIGELLPRDSLDDLKERRK